LSSNERPRSTYAWAVSVRDVWAIAVATAQACNNTSNNKRIFIFVSPSPA
jgi:hypothetical protein